MTTQAIALQFHNQSLTAAIINDLPHVALKPICDNIGLQWEGQLQRIKRHPILSSTMCITHIVAEDGKLREMVLLPLKLLNGWLFGVDTNRVKNGTREKLIEYQRECFDVLANHFMPQPQNHQIPEPSTITKAQAGELFTMVANKARSSGKPNAYFWCRFQNHFKLSSYKDTPAHQFDEAKDYLRRLEGEDTDQFRMLTPQELAAIIQQNTPSPTNPQSSLKTDDHIVLPLYQNGLVKRLTVKLDHQHQAGHYQNARWFVSRSDDQLTVEQLDHNELLMSEQKFIHYLTHECGYIVVKKTEVASKLMA